MNDASFSESDLANVSREELMSAMFANMVVQQSNMALMLLGKLLNPETGQPMQDLEAAKMFIDQLEMLECKTKGNLDKQEERLLQQSLTGLRMAFVEAVESGTEPERAASPAVPKAAAAAPAASPAGTTAAPAEDESRKKFSKKY